jgi:hypothetical protein
LELLNKKHSVPTGDLLQLVIIQIKKACINTADSPETVVMAENRNLICGEVDIGFNVVRSGSYGCVVASQAVLRKMEGIPAMRYPVNPG